MNPILGASAMTNVQKMMKGFRSPDDFLNMMETRNPQFVKSFREFQKANEGKSPEQIASENNIDISMIRRFL